MTGTAIQARYDATARFFHWSMTGLITVVFAMSFAFDAVPKASEYVLLQLHMIAGLLILALYAARLAWRITHRPPPADPQVGPLMTRVAGIGHVVLYALMLAVPLIGLAVIFLRGRGIDFGAFTIPSPLAVNRPAARSAKELHELLAWGLMLLAAGHAAVAVWHHRVLHDGVLLRMLPSR
ncbi:MAG: cytochrome b [Alsobacter sp.]